MLIRSHQAHKFYVRVVRLISHGGLGGSIASQFDMVTLDPAKATPTRHSTAGGWPATRHTLYFSY
jgi:hypothetical protein